MLETAKHYFIRKNGINVEQVTVDQYKEIRDAVAKVTGDKFMNVGDSFLGTDGNVEILGVEVEEGAEDYGFVLEMLRQQKQELLH